MCEIVESYAQEVVMERVEEIARGLFEKGVDFEVVKSSLKELTEEKLREIYESVKGTA